MPECFALELALPPKATALARALADEPGAVLLDGGAGGRSYVACWPVEVSSALDPEPALAPVASARTFGSIPRWVGLLPYEAFRGLERPAWTPVERREPPHHEQPRWYRYAAVAEIGPRVRVVGDDPSAVRELAARLRAGVPRASPSRLVLGAAQDPDEAHVARVTRALELIRDGHVYQVNLARRFELTVEGHPVALSAPMLRVAPTPFGLAGSWEGTGVVSTSPELFLETDPSGRVRTRPIKGTRPRGQDAIADRDAARALDADPKERAELSMVVDVERNDLCRVCMPGTVAVLRTPVVETHGSVHHRVWEVRGRLRPGVSRAELLGATMPSGSVTGAPKVRAMEVIAELEATRRGLYTGAYGVLRRDGTLTLAMAIRSLSVRDGVGHYHSGGGVVFDSVPEREVTETWWKAAQLTRPFGSSGDR